MSKTSVYLCIIDFWDKVLNCPRNKVHVKKWQPVRPRRTDSWRPRVFEKVGVWLSAIAWESRMLFLFSVVCILSRTCFLCLLCLSDGWGASPGTAQDASYNYAAAALSQAFQLETKLFPSGFHAQAAGESLKGAVRAERSLEVRCPALLLSRSGDELKVMPWKAEPALNSKYELPVLVWGRYCLFCHSVNSLPSQPRINRTKHFVKGSNKRRRLGASRIMMVTTKSAATIIV